MSDDGRAASYATLASFQMDASRMDEQREFLHTVLVPRVRQFPGVLQGFWTYDESTSQSHVLISFASLGAAENFQRDVRGNARNQAAMGVELTDIRVLDIVACI